MFVRDDYTCVWCGQLGGTLNADHIKPFSTHPELRFDLDNGRTLCVECHKQTDTYLSKAKKRPYIKGVQAAGKLSDDQKAFLKAVRDANGVAVVIDDPMALGLFMDALEQDPWADVPIADEIIEL